MDIRLPTPADAPATRVAAPGVGGTPHAIRIDGRLLARSHMVLDPTQ